MQINLTDIRYVYQINTPFEHQALKDITLEIPSNSFVAVIGHTGSGKSTMIQLMNGLLKPTSGTISIGSTVISSESKEKELYLLREKVGFLFQQPEHQLFEETVKDELLFAPKNFGRNVEEAMLLLPTVLNRVGLDETFLERSPYELSGGQKRRVALACLLLMNPSVYILDEPLAGLDPSGQREFMSLFQELHKEEGKTIIFITHHIDEAVRYAEQLIYMKKGTVHFYGDTLRILRDSSIFTSGGLEKPFIVRLREEIEKKTNKQLPLFKTVDELADWVYLQHSSKEANSYHA